MGIRRRRQAGAALVTVWVTTCLALSGCGSGDAPRDAEDLLTDGYLNPLAEAGFAVTVVEACRYRSPIDVPWHLSVRLRVGAEPGRVADLLEREDMWVVRDRDPMNVQQIRDDPGGGWSGILSAEDGGSVLDLVKNNVKRDGWAGAVGWAEECP